MKWITAWCLLGLLTGCDCGSAPVGPCVSASDCAGNICRDGMCVPAVDGGLPDVPETDVPETDSGIGADAGPPCGEDELCAGDARCVAGICVPFTPGEFDDECTRTAESRPVLPQIQCAFETAPDDDPRPTAVRALHTPLVANLGIRTAPDAPSRPSIVYIADYGYVERVARGCTAEGILRIIDGATCRSQTAFDDVPLNSPVTPAIGDLNGDGRPDIVAAPTEGGLIAFEVAEDGAVSELWRTTTAEGAPDLLGSTTCQWGAVSLYDLDDDGLPESLFEGGVWNSEGVRLTSLPGWTRVANGTPVPVGDFDGDGFIEAVAGNATWEFDPISKTFDIESGFSTTALAGFTAVADLGEFPEVAGDALGNAEVISAVRGVVTVRTLGGGIIASLATETSGNGGPPTVSDFDGDGVREFGVAFGGSYEVFDLEEPSMRLWSQPSQDRSSSRTGSSVFDFNGDGSAEVVYGDECYVRIYDGNNGDVLFSQARFSSTWTENPIVADVDSDGSAEMVMGASGPCRPDYCPPVDELFQGLRCDDDGDCPSGGCDSGFCRCADTAECPATYQCTAPLAGTPGAGNVCRAAHQDCVAGVRVYRDARDSWASSRTIWNQHAYHVTNVNEDGTIPRTSEVRANWSDPTLNNFRQNVQGELGESPGADLLIQSIVAVCQGPTSTSMEAVICNRGTVFLDTGVHVVFEQIADGGARTNLCDLRTTEPVAPGSCTTVSCTAPVPADGTFEVIADQEGLVNECRENNNTSQATANCLI